MRVTRSGVCHSDLHIWEGYFDLGGGKRFYVKERGCVPPFTLGHEPFGIVEALGPKAKGVKVGQKRLIHPWIGCGKCAVCKAGQENYCVSGTRILGVNRAGAYQPSARAGCEIPAGRVALVEVANLDIQQATRRHRRSIAPDDSYPRIDTPMTTRREMTSPART